MNRTVVARKHLPIHSTVSGTIAWILAMDYWDWPSWLCGAIGLCLVVGWVCVFADGWTLDQREPEWRRKP